MKETLEFQDIYYIFRFQNQFFWSPQLQIKQVIFQEFREIPSLLIDPNLDQTK